MPETFPTSPDRQADDAEGLLNAVRVGRRILHAERAARGGDWCEAFTVSPSLVALSIGDVAGHGMTSHHTMVVLRGSIRHAAHAGLDPAATLALANRVLFAVRADVCATAIFGLLDTEAGSLQFANAGHPPPLVVAADGATYANSIVADVPLGFDQHAEPANQTIDLPAGALLVLYTDGVIEHRRRPLEGEEQLRAAATYAYGQRTATPAMIIEQHIGIVQPHYDDAAILTAWLPSGA